MPKPLLIGGATLGASLLFVVSFFGFVFLSGAPLDEVAVVGPLFSDPDEAGEEAQGDEPLPTPDAHRSDDEVLASQAGVIASYAIEPPMERDRLSRLADELETTTLELREREAELEEREARVDERMEQLDRQLDELLALRGRLEEYERELELRELEVESAEQTAAQRQAAAYAETARLFATGDVEELAPRLVQFGAEEAAMVLRAMKKDRAAQLLNALPDPQWKEYQEAYARTTDG